MLSLGPVGFAEPLALIGLAALPLIWLLLRALPPPARMIVFPAATLMKGLRDSDSTAKTTPIWLRIARLAAIGAMIAGFAAPVLNPESPLDSSRGRPLLILLDGNWADASDWHFRLEKVGEFLDLAGRAERPAAVVKLTDLPPNLVFHDADDLAGSLAMIAPSPWEADEAKAAEWALSAFPREFDTYWLSDGLNREGRHELTAALESKGELTVLEGGGEILALRPPTFEEGIIRLEAVRLDDVGSSEFTVDAVGADPAGIERVLASAVVEFGQGEAAATAEFFADDRDQKQNRVLQDSRIKFGGSGRASGGFAGSTKSCAFRGANRSRRSGASVAAALFAKSAGSLFRINRRHARRNIQCCAGRRRNVGYGATVRE